MFNMIKGRSAHLFLRLAGSSSCRISWYTECGCARTVDWEFKNCILPNLDFHFIIDNIRELLRQVTVCTQENKIKLLPQSHRKGNSPCVEDPNAKWQNCKELGELLRYTSMASSRNDSFKKVRQAKWPAEATCDKLYCPQTHMWSQDLETAPQVS